MRDRRALEDTEAGVDTSIVSGWLPFVVAVAAAVLAVASLPGPPGVTARRLAVAASAALAAGASSPSGCGRRARTSRWPQCGGPPLRSPRSCSRFLFDGSRQSFDPHDPLLLVQQDRFPGLAGWFAVGDQDAVPSHAQSELVPAAQAAGIDTCAELIPGGHDFAVWREAFADALPSLAWRLGLAADQPKVAATCTKGTP